MYVIHNSDTLETIIDTLHRLQNQTVWNEKLFAGKIDVWYHVYLSEKGVGHYAIHPLLFLTTAKEKYVKMYGRFINQLKMYARDDKNLIKRLLTHFTLTTSKLNKMLQEVKVPL